MQTAVLRVRKEVKYVDLPKYNEILAQEIII